MKCEPITIAGGVGFICSRGARRKTCSVCKVRKATKLCDFPLTGRKAGKTCDRDLCGTCAATTREPGAADTTDLCPAHAAEAKRASQGFDVTDPDLDAPDGAVVDGFERHGSRWVPVAKPAKPPRAPTTQTDLDFTPPPRRDTTK